VLSKRGAARLAGCGIDEADGVSLYSMTAASYPHRMLGTFYLIERQLRGDDVATELGILRERIPFTRKALEQQYCRIPDGLAAWGIDGGSTKRCLVDWIEVEQSRKPLEERQRVFKVAFHTGRPMCLQESMVLNKLVIVVDRRKITREYLVQGFRYATRTLNQEQTATVAKRIVVAEMEIGFPLKMLSMQEVPFPEILAPSSRRNKD
jgi:hypothetical protein